MSALSDGSRRSSGSAFQAIGPATENARGPGEHAATMSWYDEMVAAGARMEIFYTTELSNYRCQLSQRFQANRSHWQGVLCDVLGANTIVNNSNSHSQQQQQ